MPSVRHKRGTRAALNALRDAGTLVPHQIYVIADEEGRLAVATAANAYTTFVRENEAALGFPLLVVGKEGFRQDISAAQFTTLRIDIAPTVDTHNAWNQATSEYTIPQNGIYDLRGKTRLQDGAVPNVSYGLGLDTVNRDAPSFFWSHTNEVDRGISYDARNGVFNSRIVRLAQGDRVRLFVYVDNERSPGNVMTVIASELNIVRIR